MATCKSCIHFDVCGKELRKNFPDEMITPACCKHYMPTADAGKWIKHEPNPKEMKEFHKQGIGVAMTENSVFWTCSICGCWGAPHYKFCQNCGAKMNGKPHKEGE